MDTLEALEFRRRIREVAEKPISDGIISGIINAGILAPSGCNRQPWKFIIVRVTERRGLINKLKQ